MRGPDQAPVIAQGSNELRLAKKHSCSVESTKCPIIAKSVPNGDCFGDSLMDMPKSRFEPDVDSVKGLAHALGVSPSTVYSWFKNGDVVAHENNGKLIVIDEESVDFMLNKLRERRRHPW